jgi:hypothetical protein
MRETAIPFSKQLKVPFDKVIVFYPSIAISKRRSFRLQCLNGGIVYILADWSGIVRARSILTGYLIRTKEDSNGCVLYYYTQTGTAKKSE